MDHWSSGVQRPSLGAFLRLCRHTSELSRPDLADAADISLSYLTKLEQGVATHPSPDKIDHVAAALKLTAPQCRHLHDLVAYEQVTPGSVDDRPPTDRITDSLRRHVDGLVPHLASYIDGCWNLLYPNPEFRRIFRHVADSGINNVPLWEFLVPEAKAILPDWDVEARRMVAWLRTMIVRQPGSRMFDALLSQLAASREFRRLWELQEVTEGRRSTPMLVHDLDYGTDIHLLAQVYTTPIPSQGVQLYLGVRTDTAAAT